MLSRTKQIYLLYMVLAVVGPASLLAQKSLAEKSRKDPVVRIPFVGCRADGQLGPMAAPKGKAKPVQAAVTMSRKLAYYKATNTAGVLAPRGWYCFGTYGSDGSILFVTPRPLGAHDLSSTTWRGLAGPAIEVSAISGDTSGRFEVARVIARYFPAWTAFVQSVIAEGIEPASQFPSGPYPKDALTYLNSRIVEYQTPPHSKGLGTVSRLQEDDDPIDGVAILKGKTPDLLLLAARLPPADRKLAAVVIHQIVQESAARN